MLRNVKYAAAYEDLFHFTFGSNPEYFTILEENYFTFCVSKIFHEKEKRRNDQSVEPSLFLLWVGLGNCSTAFVCTNAILVLLFGRKDGKMLISKILR